MVIKTAISTKKSRTLQGKDKNFDPKENSLLVKTQDCTDW
jgi:hypothetical protein